MGLITVFSGLSITKESRHSGPYIDWLEAHYPQGFEAPHVTIFNRKRLAVPDYDAEIGEEDEVSLVLLPGIDPVTAATIFNLAVGSWQAYAVSAIANALIAVGLSYALNSIFAPKVQQPQLNDSGSPSAVYSLSVPTNRARLGEPIPVIYGEVVAVPDLACQPYTFFNNGMWLAEILCLGQGEYEVDDLVIGGTAASSIQQLVFWKKYGPADHRETFGVIQENTLNGYRIRENMYVSSAVGGQQVPYSSGGSASTSSDAVYALDLPSSRVLSVSRGTVQVVLDTYVEGPAFYPGIGSQYSVGAQIGDYIVTANEVRQECNDGGFCVPFIYSATLTKYGTQVLGAVPIPDTVIAGSAVRIFNTGPQDGTYTVVSVASDRLSAVVTPQFPQATSTGQPSVFWGEEELSCGYACPSTAVVTCPKGKTTAAIEFDIVFPSGLYGVNQSGAISNSSVAFTFVFTPINDDDEAIGPCFARTQTIQAGTRTPSRHTLGYVVPDGRYKVCVTRQTSISTSTTLVNDAEWYALKSEITTSGQAYGEVTLIAVLMRASDGMASSAQNQISVKCRRILPTVLSDLQTTQATKNPSDAFYDVVTNPVYGANRPAAEADLDHLKTLATGWASKSGWNGVFDSRTTVWEALSAIGFPYHAFPATDGAVISMVEDVARTVPRFAFTEDNIADKSLTISYQFDNAEAIDGIEVLYRSPDDFSEQYALYPANSVFPEQVTAIGLTDETEAEALSQRLWKQRQLRRQFCSFTTELEGHIPLVGELITITHTMLGDDPTLWVAGSIEPQDELTVKIEGHRYVEEIYL